MTVAPPKRKFERLAALAVAEELACVLRPATARLEVAGSLRRGKAEVGDVEILYIPLWQLVLPGMPGADDMFKERTEDMTSGALSSLIQNGVISIRTNTKGNVSAWGPLNRLLRHNATDIPIDCFAATPANWFNYLVCRTGPKESNVAICRAAKKKGWKWNPYGPGFTDENGDCVMVREERDVFEHVGLPYLAPEERGKVL